jgi:hypothetical protein
VYCCAKSKYYVVSSSASIILKNPPKKHKRYSKSTKKYLFVCVCKSLNVSILCCMLHIIFIIIKNCISEHLTDLPTTIFCMVGWSLLRSGKNDCSVENKSRMLLWMHSCFWQERESWQRLLPKASCSMFNLRHEHDPVLFAGIVDSCMFALANATNCTVRIVRPYSHCRSPLCALSAFAWQFVLL